MTLNRTGKQGILKAITYLKALSEHLLRAAVGNHEAAQYNGNPAGIRTGASRIQVCISHIIVLSYNLQKGSHIYCNMQVIVDKITCNAIGLLRSELLHRVLIWLPVFKRNMLPRYSKYLPKYGNKAEQGISLAEPFVVRPAPVSCLLVALMMEAVSTSETLVN
jgi:hypothetical protein